jgi:hypothetical protein
MEYMARKLNEEYEKWGLTINLEKTKYVCIGERREILKFDGGEEIKPCRECIKHRISQTREAINALNSIWWQKMLQKIENYMYIKL